MKPAIAKESQSSLTAFAMGSGIVPEDRVTISIPQKKQIMKSQQDFSARFTAFLGKTEIRLAENRCFPSPDVIPTRAQLFQRKSRPRVTSAATSVSR
jgi:hypothetical protein